MAEKRCTCAALSAAECVCGAWDKPSASVDELMKLADEAIHAYAAWLAEFTTGDLPSFNVARLNEEKDAARRKLRAALEGACGVPASSGETFSADTPRVATDGEGETR